MRVADRTIYLLILPSVLFLTAGCGLRAGLPVQDGPMDAGAKFDASADGSAEGGIDGAAGSGSEASINCGNGEIDPGEQCDGSNLGGETCTSLGEGEGVLLCGPACFYNVTMCAPSYPEQGPTGGGYGENPTVSPPSGTRGGGQTGFGSFMDAGRSDGGGFTGFGGGGQTPGGGRGANTPNPGGA